MHVSRIITSTHKEVHVEAPPRVLERVVLILGDRRSRWVSEAEYSG